MSRKIKDAKDLTSGELIYFAGHAQATYMSDGRDIEAALSDKQDILESGSNIKTINGQSILGSGNLNIEGGGGASGGEVNLVDGVLLNGKNIVGTDKVAKIPLATSSADGAMSKEDKAKLDSTASALSEKQDTITDLATIRDGASKGATAYQKPTKGIEKADLEADVQNVLDSVGEIADKQLVNITGEVEADYIEYGFVAADGTTDLPYIRLDGATEEKAGLMTSADKVALEGKQDIITDIDTIRAGASKGATALQSYTEKYTGTYSKPTGGIPKTDLASAVQTSLGKADTALQTHQDISGKQDVITDLATIRSNAEKGASAVQPSSLAKVATSGSYNDLSNKPTIPSAVTESVVSGWGFTKNTGTYSKPSGGIPKTDLASAVQTSLGKADTALQTIKTINGQSLIGSGNVTIEGGGGALNYIVNIDELDVGDAGQVTQIYNGLYSAHQANDVVIAIYYGMKSPVNVYADEEKATICFLHPDDAYELETSITFNADGSAEWGGRELFQDTFLGVSNTRLKATGNTIDIAHNGNAISDEGITFKTINNQSIVGSGNINIKGGSGGESSKEIVLINSAEGRIDELHPNKIYIITECIECCDILEIITTESVNEEYYVYFRTKPDQMPSLGYFALPDDVKFSNGIIPEIKPETLYEFSMVKTIIENNNYFKGILTPFTNITS